MGSAERDRQRQVLWAVLAANAAFLVVEVVAGLAFSSLALLADAAHMLADVAGLGIALIAHTLVSRPASTRHTFGFQRSEVLGAQLNGVVLVAAAAWVMVEAIRRLDDVPEVEGGGLVVVATAGLLVNVASAVALARARGRSLNMRAAFVHMVADAAGSVGAIAAGVAVVTAGADWADPAVSLAIGVLVVVAAWRVLRDATHVLLEGSPAGVDPDEIAAAIAAAPGVEAVHHVHVWSLASDVPALSAHLVLAGDIAVHEAQGHGDHVRRMLERRFGVAHATLEFECHPCDPPDAEAGGHRALG